jgi:hypothetical protein
MVCKLFDFLRFGSTVPARFLNLTVKEKRMRFMSWWPVGVEQWEIMGRGKLPQLVAQWRAQAFPHQCSPAQLAQKRHRQKKPATSRYR